LGILCFTRRKNRGKRMACLGDFLRSTSFVNHVVAQNQFQFPIYDGVRSFLSFPAKTIPDTRMLVSKKTPSLRSPLGSPDFSDDKVQLPSVEPNLPRGTLKPVQYLLRVDPDPLHQNQPPSLGDVEVVALPYLQAFPYFGRKGELALRGVFTTASTISDRLSVRISHL